MCFCRFVEELQTNINLIFYIMETKEIITELKNILDDFLNEKLTFNEVIEGIEKLSKSTGIEFSKLYNAFHSSQPEFYFN